MPFKQVNPAAQNQLIDAIRALFQRVVDEGHSLEAELVEITADCDELQVIQFWIFWEGGELTVAMLSELTILHYAKRRISLGVCIEEVAGRFDELNIVVRFGGRGG